jgi:hypothetical protein
MSISIPSSGSKYVAVGVKRLTGPRRLDILNGTKVDTKAAHEEALRDYGVSPEEVELWSRAHRALGPEGLTSAGLTKFVRMERQERRERAKASVARREMAQA